MSEHVEVLERLRGVLEHGRMEGKRLISTDLVEKAIAALSAPAEAQPVAWATCNRDCDCVGECKAGVERPATPPSAPVGDAEIRKLCSWKHLMSYNESYFGEPEGELKSTVFAIERALAQQPAAVDEAMVAGIAKKLRKLRLTEVGGRRESPATTVKACLQAGLGGLYDDEAADYIVRAVLRYRDAALAAQQGGRDDG